MSPDPAAADGSARAWVEHLRAGGTTPWNDWLARTHDAGAWAGPQAGAGTDPVPGAAQLELVRLLAVRRERAGGTVPPRAFAALADRALSRSGPGRGQPHLPLLVPGTPHGVHLGAHLAIPLGAPPTDPSSLPAAELVRVGIGLLADLVVEAGPLGVPPPPRRRPWARPRLHLAGAPVTVAALRAALVAAGHREGGGSPEVLLVAQPLDEHLAQVWSARVQHGAPVRWETFAGRWARRDALPPSADLPRIAAFWAERVGASRVHVLVAPGPGDVAAALGRRRVPDPVAPSDVLPLSAEALDVLRRLNRVLNVRAPQEHREGLVRRARALLPDRSSHALSLPAARREWADRRAEEVVRAIRSGGYAVHGNLADVAPRHRGAAAPRRPEVLSVVLEACLRTAEAMDADSGSFSGGRRMSR